MAKQVRLIDIREKEHVFQCPPWSIVQIREGISSTAVMLTDGKYTPTVHVKDTEYDIRKRFES